MDFVQLIADSGIPTTRDALKAIWRNLLLSTGSKLSNDDKMSPFWRIVQALVTEPVLWLTNFIAVTVMPNAYVKYATGTYLDLLADGVNLSRKQPGKAVGNIRFSRTDTALAISIPVGTVVQTATINGVIYKLLTTQAMTFSGTNTTVDVPVIAENTGAVYNFGAAYYAILATAITGITAVANQPDWLVTPGTDLETDEDLRARVRNQFNTASDFHTDGVYRYLISQFPSVQSDAIWFEHNAPRGPGTANAFVLFDFSANAASLLTQINQYITDQGNHGHGDDLQVFQMPEQTRNFNVTVYAEKNLTAQQRTDIDTQVTDFIRAAFRENTLYNPTKPVPFARFSFSRLGEEIHLQFPLVHSVRFSVADIVTALWIPRLGTMNVTVLETE